jgi:cephalosporin hydroxylase
MDNAAGWIAHHAIFEEKAMQDMSSFYAFLSFVYTIPHDSILEIGSAYGGTLWAWQQIFKSVTSVTLTGGDWGPLDPHNSSVIYGDCSDPAVYSLVCSQHYDVIFVDGDHSETIRDVELYMPLTRVLAVHDIYTHSRLGWDHIKTKYEHIEFPGRLGIGVLFER